MIPRWSVVLMAILALIGLGSLLVGLDAQFGFIPLELMFLEYKAQIVRNSPEMSLVALGAVFPPLLAWMAALLGSAVTVHVLLGAALVSRLWRRFALLAASGSGVWVALWMLLTLLHPAVGLMLLRSPAWVLTALLLSYGLYVVMAMLRGVDVPQTGRLPATALWSPRDLTLPMVLLGFTLALLTLVRWEFWFVFPWILGAVWLTLKDRKIGFQITGLVVMGFMSLALMGGWLYLNWLPTGDALAFLHDHSSGTQLPQVQAFFLQAGWLDSARITGSWILWVTPAYAVVALVALIRSKRKGVIAMIALAPYLMEIFSYRQGLFLPEISRYGLFVVMVPVLLQACVPKQWWEKVLVTGLLGLSLLSGGVMLQTSSLVPEEVVLWRQLSGQPVVAVNEGSRLLVDPLTDRPLQQWLEQREEEHQMGSYLSQTLQSGDLVLVDDTVHFPILYWVANPYFFLTPRMQNFGFALTQPQRQVDYVLVSGFRSPIRDRDRVIQFRPEQLSDGDRPAALPGFQRELTAPYLQLLKNTEGKEPPELRNLETVS